MKRREEKLLGSGIFLGEDGTLASCLLVTSLLFERENDSKSGSEATLELLRAAQRLAGLHCHQKPEDMGPRIAATGSASVPKD